MSRQNAPTMQPGGGSPRPPRQLNQPMPGQAMPLQGGPLQGGPPQGGQYQQAPAQYAAQPPQPRPQQSFDPYAQAPQQQTFATQAQQYEAPAYAALKKHRAAWHGKRVACVLTGGNAIMSLLAKALAS